MFDNLLFRASYIGYLMTEPKLKKDKEAGNLSETAKTHLIDVFVSKKYGRQTELHNKYIQKGLMVEEDSLTLYSRVKKRFFKKNEEHFCNGYVQGTPDITDPLIDIKSSYDIYTFFRNYTKGVPDMYYWQLQTYMWLLGKETSTLAFCLVNTPDTLINDEKRKLSWRMGCATDLDPIFIEASEELERLLAYDDIDMRERVLEFKVDADKGAVEMMKSKIVKAREWLNEFNAKISPVMIAEYDQSLNATIIQ